MGAALGLGQGMIVGLTVAGADDCRRDRCRLRFETKARVEALGRRFLEIKADLRTLAPIQSIADQAVAAFGKIDILVNNAGLIRRADSLEFLTEK